MEFITSITGIISYITFVANIKYIQKGQERVSDYCMRVCRVNMFTVIGLLHVPLPMILLAHMKFQVTESVYEIFNTLTQ